MFDGQSRPECGKCGRKFGNKGNLTMHFRACQRAWTVDQLLEMGEIDSTVGEDACWLWTSDRSQVYGYVVGGGLAHREMHLAAIGPIPDGHVVCHSCDTPRCVNPRHLWTGTQKSNINDAVSKDRMKGNRGKRSPEQVEQMRARRPKGNLHWTKRNPEAYARWVEAMKTGRRRQVAASKTTA